mmetsp:Transcript_4885/g.4132  ORF Transcript_4885/g.4132 Transcript_4885/m.4132 type:complete len:121 (+) Transcript_4885:1199-1561(+)
MKYTENQLMPNSINHDFESTNDIRLACEPSQLNVGEASPPQKPNGDSDSTNESGDHEFDEFDECERGCSNITNMRDKIDLGYSTISYRTSLIPEVKSKHIIMKKNILNCHLTQFDKLILK